MRQSVLSTLEYFEYPYSKNGRQIQTTYSWSLISSSLKTHSIRNSEFEPSKSIPMESKKLEFHHPLRFHIDKIKHQNLTKPEKES